MAFRSEFEFPSSMALGILLHYGPLAIRGPFLPQVFTYIATNGKQSNRRLDQMTAAFVQSRDHVVAARGYEFHVGGTKARLTWTHAAS